MMTRTPPPIAMGRTLPDVLGPKHGGSDNEVGVCDWQVALSHRLAEPNTNTRQTFSETCPRS